MSLHAVNFSKMDTTIVIEYPVEADSVSGESQKPTWAVLKTCQAERRYRSGTESEINNQLAGRNPIDYTIRYDSANPINFKMRIREALGNAYGYIGDLQDWPREGYTFISVNRWDNG